MSAKVSSDSAFLRLEGSLRGLFRLAAEGGISEAAPEMQEAFSVLQVLQQARAVSPATAGVAGHCVGPWHVEYLQDDMGASLAVLAANANVVVVMPPANREDHGIDADESLDAENVPREPYDLPNIRRLTACVNACDGLPTAMLEALRPELVPFVDRCGKNFVIYSATQAEQDDGAGFWSAKRGWVDFEKATRYTQEETGFISLHMAPDAAWTDLAEARLVLIEREGFAP